MERRERYVDEGALNARDKIANAFNDVRCDFDLANLAERLGAAFDWTRSPQGFEFWFSISQALYALAKRQNVPEAEKGDRQPVEK